MIARFLSDYLEKMTNTEDIIFTKQLYDKYNEWKMEVDYREDGMNLIKFGTKLSSVYKISKPLERSAKGARCIINKKKCQDTLMSLGYIESHLLQN